MLIEEIIEFELRGPGLPGPSCTLTNGIFYEKKTPRKILEWIIIGTTDGRVGCSSVFTWPFSN